MFEIKYDKNGDPIQNRTPEPSVQSPLEEVVTKSNVESQSSQNESLITEEGIINTEPSTELSQNTDVPEHNLSEESPKETSKERNMRVLREAKESAERDHQRVQKERDEAIRRSEEMERYYKSQQKQKTQEDSDDFSIGEDDLAEGKHLKKIYKEVKDLKKQVEYYKNNAQTNSLESRIRSDFPDFAKVVTADNITILKQLQPRKAALLDKSTDMYETAALAYEMIKEYGIYEQEDMYVAQRQATHNNAIKPKPLASISPQKAESPLSRANAFANEFTPELAAQLRKEMADIRKAH